MRKHAAAFESVASIELLRGEMPGLEDKTERGAENKVVIRQTGNGKGI